jgi:biotin operon repressor
MADAALDTYKLVKKLTREGGLSESAAETLAEALTHRPADLSTKQDLEPLATRKDLEPYATKADLNICHTDLGQKIEGVRTDLGKDIEAVRAELAKESEAIRTDLGKEIEGVRNNLGKDIQALRTDVGKDIAELEARLSNKIRTTVISTLLSVTGIFGIIVGLIVKVL